MKKISILSEQEMVGNSGKALLQELYGISDKALQPYSQYLERAIPEAWESYAEGLLSLEEILEQLSNKKTS